MFDEFTTMLYGYGFEDRHMPTTVRTPLVSVVLLSGLAESQYEIGDSCGSENQLDSPNVAVVLLSVVVTNGVTLGGAETFSLTVSVLALHCPYTFEAPTTTL